MKIEFNLGRIKGFMADFYNVTNIQVAVFNADFDVLLQYPYECNKVCTWIKQSGEGKLRCDRSTTAGLQACRACGKKAYTWRCHAGMMEWGFPIYMQAEIIGYIIFGQLIDGSEGERENIRQRLHDLEGSRLEVESLINGLRVIGSDFIHSAAQLMVGCIHSVLFEDAFKVQYDPVWMRIDRYIDENLTLPLRLEDIAEHTYVSPSTVSHKVKKVTGKSVGEVIMLRRMNQARMHLIQTDFKIGEIAALVGITDYNYFSRVFRKTFGCSPNQYRKSMAGLSPERQNELQDYAIFQQDELYSKRRKKR